MAKKKKTIKVVCHVCGGSGLIVSGLASREGRLCSICNGHGSLRQSYEPFRKRRRLKKIDRVLLPDGRTISAIDFYHINRK